MTASEHTTSLRFLRNGYALCVTFLCGFLFCDGSVTGISSLIVETDFIDRCTLLILRKFLYWIACKTFNEEVSLVINFAPRSVQSYRFAVEFA